MKLPASVVAQVPGVAGADKHQIDLLGECCRITQQAIITARHVGKTKRCAERTDIGKLVKMRLGDLPGLCAAPGKPGHGPMLPIGYRAVGRVNHWDDVLDQHLGYFGALPAAETAPAAALWSCARCIGCRGRWCRSCRSRSATAPAAKATTPPAPTAAAADSCRHASVLHDDQHR